MRSSLQGVFGAVITRKTRQPKPVIAGLFFWNIIMLMARAQKISTPVSREVRLYDPKNKALFGDAEQIAFDIYSGDAGTLASSMVRLELVMERDRSRTIEAFAFLLRQKLVADGYIVIDDIDRLKNQWHEDEVLGIGHGMPLSDSPDEFSDGA